MTTQINPAQMQQMNDLISAVQAQRDRAMNEAAQADARTKALQRALDMVTKENARLKSDLDKAKAEAVLDLVPVVAPANEQDRLPEGDQ